MMNMISSGESVYVAIESDSKKHKKKSSAIPGKMYDEFFEWIETDSIVDGGATISIAKLNSLIQDFCESKSVDIKAFDSKITRSMGSGTIFGIMKSVDGDDILLKVPNTHKVSGADKDLISQNTLLDNGYEFHYTKKFCYMMTPEQEMVRLDRRAGLFWLKWYKAVDKRVQPSTNSDDEDFAGSAIETDPYVLDAEGKRVDLGSFNDNPDKIVAELDSKHNSEVVANCATEHEDGDAYAGVSMSKSMINDVHIPCARSACEDELMAQEIDVRCDKNPFMSSFNINQFCMLCSPQDDDVNDVSRECSSDNVDADSANADPVMVQHCVCEVKDGVDNCTLADGAEEAVLCQCYSVVKQAPAKSVSMQLMHSRCGHINGGYIKYMARKGKLDVKVTGGIRSCCCKSCRMSKATRNNPPPQREGTPTPTRPFQYVYTDL
mmetsp:Transcript_33558/g.39430  ORF Transcript_33558/g.39430 Transcript_33558/m.39430 type:complete len:435 (+) Transcript_33558:282-1586(+)